MNQNRGLEFIKLVPGRFRVRTASGSDRIIFHLPFEHLKMIQTVTVH